MDIEAGRMKSDQRGVRGWVIHLDRILRGDATRLSTLRRGTIEVPPGGVSLLLAALGMVYGVCMGCFALFKVGRPVYVQLAATMVKVPALFFLTLAVTLPSLYVFNALVGSRLTLSSVIRLLVASLAIMLAVLASLGPIVALFSVSTTSYAFMILLNVLVYGLSGSLGLVFLLQTLHRLSLAQQPLRDEPEGPVEGHLIPVEPPGALDQLDDRVLAQHVKTVFRIWVIVFGLVGAQMSWVLRPFIGDPNHPFAWFRPRESNFFQAVFAALWRVLG